MIKRYSLILSIVLTFILIIAVANDILVPFVFGFIFAYLFSPLVELLEKFNISRTVGSSAVIAGVLLLFVLILVTLLPSLIVEAKSLSLITKKLPNILREMVIPYVQGAAEKFGFKLNFSNMMTDAKKSEYMSSVFNYSSMGLNKIYLTGVNLVSAISLWMLTPIVAFYFLKDWDLITRKTKKIIPLKYKKYCDEILRDINRVLSGYIRGQFSLCFIMAVYYSIALLILGLHNGLVLGIISGAAVLLPYVGAGISALIAVGIAAAQFKSLDMVLITLGLYVFGQAVESNFIAPKLIGDKIKLNPLWLIFALLAGGNLMGLSGIIISIPIAGILGVVIRHLLDYYYRSEAYNR